LFGLVSQFFFFNFKSTLKFKVKQIFEIRKKNLKKIQRDGAGRKNKNGFVWEPDF
jgi:hypothetical protein